MLEYALSQGDIVVATLRKPEVLSDLAARYPADKLLVLKVDVCKEEDIDAAFSRTREAYGRLDIVFNNAGYGIFAEIEGTPIDKAHEMFETNFWGATNVSRAAVKFFREVNEPGKGGVLLQMSSTNVTDPFPGLGYYAATKHALEGFSDCFGKELPPSWNIKICTIEPGAFQTNVMNSMELIPQHPAYADESFTTSVSRRIVDGVVSDNMVFKVGDAEKFVRTVYQVVRGGKIPQHLPMGLDAIEMLTAKIESLKATLAETVSWSADLK